MIGRLFRGLFQKARGQEALEAQLLRALASGPQSSIELRDQVGVGPSLYPALRQLERDGKVVSFEGMPMDIRGGRPRRYYKLKEQP